MRAALLVAVLPGVGPVVPLAGAPAASPPDQLDPVPPQEYPVYDQVVVQKFLTSQTRLVVIRPVTATRLVPGGGPATLAFFREGAFFEGRLSEELIRDFVLKAARPFRLEKRFDFGVPYRLRAGDEPAGPEVFLAPLPVGVVLAPSPTVGALEFSRVAFSAKGDAALVYVGDHRPDGSGVGFLALLHRTGARWEVTETDVLWVARPDAPPPE